MVFLPSILLHIWMSAVASVELRILLCNLSVECVWLAIFVKYLLYSISGVILTSESEAASRKLQKKEVAVYTEDRGQGNTNWLIKSEFIIILGKLSLSVEIQIRFWSDCLIETRWEAVALSRVETCEAGDRWGRRKEASQHRPHRTSQYSVQILLPLLDIKVTSKHANTCLYYHLPAPFKTHPSPVAHIRAT